VILRAMSMPHVYKAEDLSQVILRAMSMPHVYKAEDLSQVILRAMPFVFFHVPIVLNISHNARPTKH
jgi:hypothetical protein